MDYKAKAYCIRDFDRPDVGAVCYLRQEPEPWQEIGAMIFFPLMVAFIIYVVIENIRNSRKDNYCSWR